jgi:glycerol-3-phosphate dehydrogenase
VTIIIPDEDRKRFFKPEWNLTMPKQGKILYDWPNAGIEETLVLSAPDQLGTEPYDVTIVGAGVVGCAVAYILSQYQLRVLLVEKRYDVGEGTSKANSAIVHTGFDATPGSLESQLVTRASRKWPELAQKLKIPFEPLGAFLLAVNDEQEGQLEKIHAKALTNGVDDVRLVDAAEAKRLEPNASSDVRGGFLVPRESIADPFATSIAFAEVAIANGVDILLGAHIIGLENGQNTVKNLVTESGHRIKTCLLVNAAGLGGRDLADLYNGTPFDINPRRGQFLIFDKACRKIVQRILLPVPTKETKGVLIIPTIFGNLMAGPTAEDFPLGSPEATNTTAEGLQWMLSNASGLCPGLLKQPVIGTYAGERCNCKQGSYLIRYNDGYPGILTIAGIRSTGFTSSITLAEYVTEGLSEQCDLSLDRDPDATDSRADSCWPGWWRKPINDAELVGRNPDYADMVCFCEQISRGEIVEALDSMLKPRTFDAVKRRTRISMGRCQGFECRIRVAKSISEHCDIPLDRITQKGPGSELVAPTNEAMYA